MKGRWHDSRHTLITELAESGAGDQTIMDIAGHVGRRMLARYSHRRGVRSLLHAAERLWPERREPSVGRRAADASESNVWDFNVGLEIYFRICVSQPAC